LDILISLSYVVLSFHRRVELPGRVVRTLVPSPFTLLGRWSVVVSLLTFPFALCARDFTHEYRGDEHQKEFDDAAHDSMELRYFRNGRDCEYLSSWEATLGGDTATPSPTELFSHGASDLRRHFHFTEMGNVVITYMRTQPRHSHIQHKSHLSASFQIQRTTSFAPLCSVWAHKHAYHRRSPQT
jgi:hypothetical protein